MKHLSKTEPTTLQSSFSGFSAQDQKKIEEISDLLMKIDQRHHENVGGYPADSAYIGDYFVMAEVDENSESTLVVYSFSKLLELHRQFHRKKRPKDMDEVDWFWELRDMACD